MDNKPLSNSVVTFQPEGGGMASFGTTDESGRYTLKALRDEFDGAVVAKHRVVIRTANTRPVDTTSDRDDPKSAERIPKKYNVETELTIEVPEGGRDDADFNLSSK
jgi:hypothetical protein